MLVTAVYRQQHKTLLELVGQVPTSADKIEESAVLTQLFKITSLLRAHLKLEDEKLYPALLAHSSQEVRAMAKRFQDEMGSLLGAYNQFYDKWSANKAVSGDTTGFLGAWKGIVDALGLRIAREDNELYDLADRTPNLILS